MVLLPDPEGAEKITTLLLICQNDYGQAKIIKNPVGKNTCIPLANITFLLSKIKDADYVADLLMWQNLSIFVVLKRSVIFIL